MSIARFFKKPTEVRPNVVEFVCDFPKCKLSIPARPTVRQQMEYFSATAGTSKEKMLTRFWEGAKVLFQSWECDVLPDYKTDTDEMDNPEQAEIITWAALQVKAYMDGLENIPKN